MSDHKNRRLWNFLIGNPPAGEGQRPARRRRRQLRCEVLETRWVMAGDCQLGDPLEGDPLDTQSKPPLADAIEFSAEEAPRGSALGPSGSAVIMAADDTASGATDLGTLRGSVTIDDSVGWSDRRDYYKFTLGERSDVSLALSGLAADADLYVYDSRGNLLGRGIRSGTSPEKLAGQLGAGTYYVLVYAYNGETPYQLTVTGPEQAADPDTVGNSFAEAYDLGTVQSTASFSERVGNGDTADVFRFTLPANGQLQAVLTGLADDADLYLYSSNGSLLGSSRRSGSTSEGLQGTLSAGTYYAAIVPYGSAATAYQFTVNFTPPAAPSPEDPGTGTDPGTDSGTDPGTPPPSEPISFPEVPYFGGADQWGLNAINAPEVWARDITGEGIVVAVIDTGVDWTHPDLAGSLWVNAGEIAGNGLDDDGNGYVDDVRGWDFVSQDADPHDGNGHGTHVAGTIAATRNSFGQTGVAYDSQIMALRVLDNQGRGTMFSVAAGIRYAVDNGADVINLSLGGGYSSVLLSALQYAQANGVFVVAAAGNEAASVPGYPASFSANLSNVLSVGAYAQNLQLASFSNDVGGSGAVQVDAPGVSIYSTLPGQQYARYSGTSMATPHVAGVAALALSANSQLTPEQLRAVITQGATFAIAGSDALGGVNAAAALSLALAGSGTSGGSAATSGGEVAGGGEAVTAGDAAAWTASMQVAPALTGGATSVQLVPHGELADRSPALAESGAAWAAGAESPQREMPLSHCRVAPDGQGRVLPAHAKRAESVNAAPREDSEIPWWNAVDQVLTDLQPQPWHVAWRS